MYDVEEFIQPRSFSPIYICLSVSSYCCYSEYYELVDSLKVLSQLRLHNLSKNLIGWQGTRVGLVSNYP